MFEKFHNKTEKESDQEFSQNYPKYNTIYLWTTLYSAVVSETF